MALPAGMTACVYTFGSDLNFRGDTATLRVVIEPDLGGDANYLVWVATGQPLDTFPFEVEAAAGQTASIQLPHVDQDGFVNPAQETYKGFAYRATIIATDPDGTQRIRYKTLQPLVGQTAVDGDAIPDGTTTAPIIGPAMVVTDFGGKTGSIDIGDHLVWDGQTLSAELSSGGDGDVIGPPSSTDRAVALYDGIGGKLLRDSAVTIDADGAVDGVTTINGRDPVADGDVLDAHVADTDNPHGVTKADVGLSNVDNTADSAKPVSAAAQAALDGKQPLDADLTAIAALSPADDSILQRISGSWVGRTMAQLKTSLGLTKSDVGLSNVDNVQQQPLDSDLTAIAGLTPTNGDIITRAGGVWTAAAPPGGAGSGDVTGPASSVDNSIPRFDGTGGKTLQGSGVTISDTNNMSTPGTVDGRDLSVDGTKLDGIEAGADVTDAANVAAAGAHMAGGTDVPVADGGTGRSTGGTANGIVAVGTTATGPQQTITPGTSGHLLKSNGSGSPASFSAGTKSDVGLANVDNTSDANKPVSTAQAAADAAATAAAQATSLQKSSNLSDLANAGTARTNLGLGTAAVEAATAFDAAGAAAAAQAASQPLDSDLTAIAAIAPANDDVIQRKSGSWVSRTIAQLKTDLGLTKSDVGLANVDNVQQQPLDSDLTDIAALSSANDSIMQRKSGAWTGRTPAQVKTDLALTAGDVGLGNVDNTSDATKNSATATLTNKRITRRVFSTADTATLTIDADSYDAAKVTALAQAMTIAAPTGTATAMQSLIIRIKDNGTARALTWDAAFRAIGVTLPTTTVISKTIYIGCIRNTDDSKWDVIAVATQA